MKRLIRMTKGGIVEMGAFLLSVGTATACLFLDMVVWSVAISCVCIIWSIRMIGRSI